MAVIHVDQIDNAARLYQIGLQYELSRADAEREASGQQPVSYLDSLPKLSSESEIEDRYQKRIQDALEASKMN